MKNTTSIQRPDYIQRNFEKKEHLDSFMSGNIRMGLAEAYRLSEHSSRGNPREGYFSGQINRTNGKSGFNSSSCLGLFYLLCFSTPTTKTQKKEEYGEFSLRIRDIDLLFNRIKEKIGNSNLDFSTHGKVTYKDFLEKTPSTNEFFFEHFKTHIENQEYRFLFHLKQWPDVGFHPSIEVSEEKQRCLVDIDIPMYITVKDVLIKDICEVSILHGGQSSQDF